MTPVIKSSDNNEIIPQWHRDFQQSFDMFTIRLTGSKFNGEEVIIDESGGLWGRMNMRVTVLERGFKYMGYAVSLMFALIVLTKGLEHAGSFVRMIEWLVKL